MLGGFIFKYNPKNGSVKKIAEGKNVSGIALRKHGGLICACHQGVYSWEVKKRLSAYRRYSQRGYLKVKDAIVADASGRFLFGSAFYGPGLTTYPLGKFYKVERDGSISTLEKGMYMPNGLCFSSHNRDIVTCC